MAMSFAEEECKIRRITEIELRTGGTNPQMKFMKTW